MGTRNLTCVIHNSEFKVAQYCQWDGYLEGQGLQIVNFLITRDLDLFKEKLIKFVNLVSTEDAWRSAPEKFRSKTSLSVREYEELKNLAPHLIRDTGAGILDIIYNLNSEINLADDHLFAADSLFCEWAYVINLDNSTLEIYKGFNKAPLLTDERFSKIQSRKDSEYLQVKQYRVLSFDGLKESYNNTISEYKEECSNEG